MKTYITMQELSEQDLKGIQGGTNGHTPGGCTPIIVLYPQPSTPSFFSLQIA